MSKSTDHSVFKWELSKADILYKRVGFSITSPKISALGGSWEIKVYPRGPSKYYTNCPLLAIRLLKHTKSIETEVILSFLYEDHSFFLEFGSSRTIYTPESWEYHKIDYITMKHHVRNLRSTFSILCEFIEPGTTVINDTTPSNFFDALNNPHCSDVKFLVNDKYLYAHKILLINRSKAFAKIQGMIGTTNTVVIMEDIEYDVLLELLRYIYTGTINNIDKVAKPLLIAADKYELDDLKLDCGKILGQQLTEENIEEYLELSNRHNVYTLKHRIIDFMADIAYIVTPNTPKLMPLVEELHRSMVVGFITPYECLNFFDDEDE